MGSASSNGGVRAVFSVHHGVIGRTSNLYCWGVYKKWRVAGSTTACISHPLCAWSTGDCSWQKNYLPLGKVYEQLRLTLEALKEAIRQEVAAITPEMILKVMDNYRERLHQCINIQDRHLSDVLFKTHRCKTAFCVLSRNKKKNICRIFFGFEFISFPNRGVLSAAPCTFCVQTNKHKQREYSTRTSCMRKQGPQHQGSRIRVEFWRTAPATKASNSKGA